MSDALKQLRLSHDQATATNVSRAASLADYEPRARRSTDRPSPLRQGSRRASLCVGTSPRNLVAELAHFLLEIVATKWPLNFQGNTQEMPMK